MPQDLAFDKYQKRSPDYHWQQLGRNVFRFNAYVSARYQQVVKLLKSGKNLKVLDIGCGDGVLLSLIGSGKLYGIDLDKDSLDFAGGKIKAKLVKGKAENLPFKNSFFDAVIATEIIEHLGRPGKLLAESFRVLRPGGRLIITTPVKQLEGLTDPLHMQEFSPDELKQLCRQYFRRAKVITSHPLWLKRVYSWSAGRLGRFHLNLGRWLINLGVLLTGWNPFLKLAGKPSQQLIICQK